MREHTLTHTLFARHFDNEEVGGKFLRTVISSLIH